MRGASWCIRRRPSQLGEAGPGRVDKHKINHRIARYEGTLVLVSHDRALLDAATDHTLALEGDGKAVLHEGNYTLWRNAKAARLAKPAAKNAPVPEAIKPSAHALSKERARLQKRVTTIEDEIAMLETTLAKVEATLARGEGDLFLIRR